MMEEEEEEEEGRGKKYKKKKITQPGETLHKPVSHRKIPCKDRRMPPQTRKQRRWRFLVRLHPVLTKEEIGTG
jgi:hypothetical protein